MNRYHRFVQPEIIFGPGALSLAGRYAGGFEARRALLVSDRGVMEAGWTDRVEASLEEAGVCCVRFLDVSPNPRDHQVAAGLAACAEGGCDLIVAVGGGSPMDCAKGISILSTNGGSILDYEGVDRIPMPGLPLICIPTTSGSSADVSQFAIISDTARRVKIAIISKKAIPDAALIDPDTTSTMPPDLTAATGMDALCHAIEAYVSLGASPLTDLPALEAVRLVGRHLARSCQAAEPAGPAPEAAARDGPDTDAETARQSAPAREAALAREGMTLASLLAGEAFSNASLGLVHAMAHALGGLLDAPHGLCNALLLDKVILANAEAAEPRYAELARALREARLAAAAGQGARPGSAPDRGPPPRVAPGDGAAALAEEVRGLRKAVGLDTSLSALGVKAGDLALLSAFAAKDPCLATNPRKTTIDEIAAIYARAL